ncbi:hypothetical protein [Enterococcus faecalis]|uniref:hypothetical protein n=1 Tax=Enterococcus faecalis TaxID=1351 RepID=UPI0030C7F1E4
MSEKIRTACNNIYKFTIVEENGENIVHTPKMDLPECVKERIKFFGKYLDDGMTFTGCLRMIMAKDEEKAKQDFGIGAYEDYLPASEEFKQWRDDIALRNLHQMEIAVALIYGLGEEAYMTRRSSDGKL